MGVEGCGDEGHSPVEALADATNTTGTGADGVNGDDGADGADGVNGDEKGLSEGLDRTRFESAWVSANQDALNALLSAASKE